MISGNIRIKQCDSNVITIKYWDIELEHYLQLQVVVNKL